MRKLCSTRASEPFGRSEPSRNTPYLRILDPQNYKARLLDMWANRGTRYDVSDTFHRALAEKLVQFIRPQQGQQVLDVATGTGMVATPIAELVGHLPGKVVGIDISESMILEVSNAITGAKYVLAAQNFLLYRISEAASVV